MKPCFNRTRTGTAGTKFRDGSGIFACLRGFKWHIWDVRVYISFGVEAANNACRRRELKIRDRNLRVCHAKSDAFLSKVKEGPSNGFPRRRSPTTASTSTPSGKGERRKRAAADSASYEGTRSSKTGAVKKKSTFSPHRSSSSTGDGGSRSSSWSEQHDRKKKRPAVAARKAKQLQKRKQPSGTPENSRRVKRARRQ